MIDRKELVALFRAASDLVKKAILADLDLYKAGIADPFGPLWDQAHQHGLPHAWVAPQEPSKPDASDVLYHVALWLDALRDCPRCDATLIDDEGQPMTMRQHVDATSCSGVPRPKFPVGIWTPCAAILCMGCHGPTVGVGAHERPFPRYEKILMDRVEPKEHESLGRCDQCDARVVLPAGLAAEQTAVRELKKVGVDAFLSQTGGMCSAAEVVLGDPEKHWIYITDDEAGRGMMIGLYNDETCGDPVEAEYLVEEKDVVEVVQKMIKKVCDG